ncbi:MULTISPECIES: hypothetical protein [unclassified Campylobacter]|uniref:hypothetical protein n=1 Tax=unclassified Campylobacter TaxID=2593542 RepID=UPI00148578E6|nr:MULTISPECIES: hypothetical protein [unclassified Campylobacter]
MIEEFCDYLGLKYIKSIDLSQLSKKRVYRCALASEFKDEDTLVFSNSAQARFVCKDALFLFELKLKLIQHYQHIQNCIIFIKAPLCSKAKKLLDERQIKHYAFV